MWNDDWDSNPVVIDDMLYQGGENSWWYAVKLNRSIGADGKVAVDPQVVWKTPAWTDELMDVFGRQHSVEGSTAVFDQAAYFATSAGRVVGVDVSDVGNGNAEIFFDLWIGDDTDATISIDDEGFLYVVSHSDTAKTNNTSARRVRDVGHLLKLDPSQEGDAAIVWHQELPAARGQDAGAWATPALHPDGVIFVATDAGDLQAYDTASGELIWDDFVGGNAWSSPVIADGTLVIAVNCLTEDHGLRVYDLSDPRSPERRWESRLGEGCIESTPAVWNGQIFVGSRDGFFYALDS
jgi:outer membrane protein assembly factor BamB